MNTSLGIVMDPIQRIKSHKDSSLAMLLAAQKKGWSLYYIELKDLFSIDGRTWARVQHLSVSDNAEQWFEFLHSETIALDELDVILMRKDPPFDMQYIYATYLLEQAEARGTLVVNRPAALRDANEKLYSAWFPDCCPPTLVSSMAEDFLRFLQTHHDIIIKPLDGMGGASIFRIRESDPNTNVIIETLTLNGAVKAMAQQFIPEISAGDKRILVVAGEAIPYAYARVPRPGENRGNLAAGGSGHGLPLTDRDQWIVEQVSPRLLAAGILFAGLDVIGNFLTEINVTSPTCIRELDKLYDLDIGTQLMDAIEQRLNS